MHSPKSESEATLRLPHSAVWPIRLLAIPINDGFVGKRYRQAGLSVDLRRPRSLVRIHETGDPLGLYLYDSYDLGARWTLKKYRSKYWSL